MTPAPGALVTLAIDRPAVGGRMIARHDGAIVLVAGAIPGERVVARIERVQRKTIFARTVEVLEASPDRVDADAGLAGGGQVLAHVSPARQAVLKAEMIGDAFRRLGRVDVGAVPVATGAADGYRTRARIHVRQRALGVLRRGHARRSATSPPRASCPARAQRFWSACAPPSAPRPETAAEVEWAESLDGQRKVAHVAFDRAVGPHAMAPVEGLDGASWSDDGGSGQAWGDPFVVDTVQSGAVPGAPLRVRHHVRAFFQGNRFLLQGLVDDVVSRVDGAEVADLYAGVGLFSVVLAGAGRAVEAVEGDAFAAADLQANAGPTSRVRVQHRPVEAFVRRSRLGAFGTVIVDPPRTGLSPEVSGALAGARVPQIVYVSCDAATLARDVRLFVEAGYGLADVRAHDLFPRTAHVEIVVTLARAD